jgi:hypothetical protein
LYIRIDGHYEASSFFSDGNAPKNFWFEHHRGKYLSPLLGKIYLMLSGEIVAIYCGIKAVGNTVWGTY